MLSFIARHSAKYLHKLGYLILVSSLYRIYLYYYLHFTDKETKA